MTQPIQVDDGKIVIVDGKIAVGDTCCCGPTTPCGDCAATYYMDVSGFTGDCAALNGTYYAPHDTDCAWQKIDDYPLVYLNKGTFFGTPVWYITIQLSDVSCNATIFSDASCPPPGTYDISGCLDQVGSVTLY
jgi:hypothetical protein